MASQHTLRALSLSTALLATTLLGPDAIAQDQPKRLKLPAQPIVAMHIDGPQRIRTAFLPTDMGKMFAGKEFRDMTAPLAKMLVDLKKELGANASIDADALADAIYNYGGRLSIGLYADGKDLPLIATEMTIPEFSLFLVLEPDGKTDLAAFCKKCASLAEEGIGDQLSDLKALGRTLRVREGDPEEGSVSVTLPFMMAGNAVVCLGTDLSKALELLENRDQKPTFQPHKIYQDAPFGMLFNARRVIGIIEEACKGQFGEIMYEGMGIKACFEKSGLKSLETFEMSIYPKKVHVVEDVVLSFNGKDRGLLAAFLPLSRERSPLIDVLPRDAASASTFYVDVPMLRKGLHGLLDDMGESGPKETVSELESAFETMFGFRLHEDFLSHFGKHGIVVQRRKTGDTETSTEWSQLAAAGAEGLCLGFEVKDISKVSKNLQKLLRSRGLHAAQKKSEFKGYTTYDLSVFGVTRLHYAFSDRMLLGGFGDSGAKTLRTILQLEADRRAGKKPGPFPKGVQRRLNAAEPGWVGFGFTNVAAALEQGLGNKEALADLNELEPGLGDLLLSLQKMSGLLRNANLAEQVHISRQDGRRYTLRYIW